MTSQVYEFYTPTTLPIEAFTVMGLSAKPNSTNPIGQFGTGLKLSVATVLRLGGTFELFIDGTEYVFYAKSTKFRGSDHKQVMMRRRKGITARFSYHELPFTLNYGRNLEAWQVFRELESNTRDEGGESGWCEGQPPRAMGTTIRVSMPGLAEVVENGKVFLSGDQKVLWECKNFRVLEGESNCIYYIGVRVFKTKYPSRFTYDFKQDEVKLTEDRSPENVWWLIHLIQQRWMTTNVDRGLIYRMLSHKDEVDPPRFETHELTFDATTPGITVSFAEAARRLSLKGFTSTKIAAFVSGYGTHVAKSSKVKLELDASEIPEILRALHETGRIALEEKIRRAAGWASDDIPF